MKKRVILFFSLCCVPLVMQAQQVTESSSYKEIIIKEAEINMYVKGNAFNYTFINQTINDVTVKGQYIFENTLIAPNASTSIVLLPTDSNHSIPKIMLFDKGGTVIRPNSTGGHDPFVTSKQILQTEQISVKTKSYSVYDSTGMKMFTQTLENSEKINLNLQSLKPGLYIIHLELEDSTIKTIKYLIN